jgi:hypothetical protein
MPRTARALLDRPWSREPAWTFIRAHWSELSGAPRQPSAGMPTIVNGLGSFCSSAARERGAAVLHRSSDADRESDDRAGDSSASRAAPHFASAQAPAFSRWLSGAS